MFFLMPFAYGSAVGFLILGISLLLKRLNKPSVSKIPSYLGVIAGIGTVFYRLKEVRGFEGAFVGLLGLTIIIWTVCIFLFLFFSNKKKSLIN